MNGHEITQKINKMNDEQLLKKYNVMNEYYDANEDINLEIYFKLVDELNNRNLL